MPTQGVVDTVADAARAAAGALRGSMDRAELAVHGASAAGAGAGMQASVPRTTGCRGQARPCCSLSAEAG